MKNHGKITSSCVGRCDHNLEKKKAPAAGFSSVVALAEPPKVGKTLGRISFLGFEPACASSTDVRSTPFAKAL